MSELPRKTVDPASCGDRACLRGVGILVKDVLALLAAAMNYGYALLYTDGQSVDA